MTDIFAGDPKIFETDASFIAYRVTGTGPALLLLHCLLYTSPSPRD